MTQYPGDTVARIEELVKQGFTKSAISAKLGIPRTTVRRYIKHNLAGQPPPRIVPIAERLTKEQIVAILRARETGSGYRRIASQTGINIQLCRRACEQAAELYTELNDLPPPVAEADEEVVEENVRLQKQTVRFADKNRIERKAFREYARFENAMVEVGNEISKTLRGSPLHGVPALKKHAQPPALGITHLTDHHYNELIEMVGNVFDFEIAAKRDRLYVERTKRIYDSRGVNKILVAMTGDMLNSDRRLDEKLNAAANRARALVLATDLLQQMILDYRKDYEVVVAYVAGNESRCDPELGFSPKVLSNSYDTMLFHCLEERFHDTQGINFFTGNPVELVVPIDGFNILLLHGMKYSATTIERDVQSTLARYAAKGIRIHYVLCGHVHATHIGDFVGRGGSLPGSNSYSEYGLNLSGRSSQNCYVIDRLGRIDATRIDLQITDDIEGYPIQSRLASYNSQAADKRQGETPILKIVI
jgi:predicted phosphodiesterase